MDALQGLPASPGGSRKTLGAATLAAVIVGIAISQVALVGVLQGVGVAGQQPLWMIGIAFGCAYLLAISYALSFSELSLMMPSSGGLSTYTEVAIGNFPALLATFSGYVVVNVFGVPAELMLFDSVVREIGGIPLPPKVLALGLLAVLALLNIRGTDVFAALQNSTAVLKVGLILVSGLAIFWLAPHDAPAVAAGQGTAPGVSSAGFGMVVGLFFWCFVGAEFICPMIGEVKNPRQVIPRSMLLGITALAVLFGLYSLGARALVPQDVLINSAFPHLDFAKAVFGRVGAIVLLLTAITATIGLVNAVLAGISRLLEGMALNGQAFGFLAWRHARYDSPWAAIVAISVTFAIPILLLGGAPETIMNLVIAASTSWLVAYIVAHINLIVLRRRYPHAARPFRSPFFPLPQLVGIAGMVYVISSSPSEVLVIAGYVLGLVGMASALWTRFVMKRGLFVPEPLAVLDDQDV
jgi:amino acid transporter